MLATLTGRDIVMMASLALTAYGMVTIAGLLSGV